MPLSLPNLDSRTFDDLVEEARQRIPRYTPEWTNFNDSDPGMTLVKLHAWMTETILFELNRVPELNYIAFLNLIGLSAEPARPARTQLGFTLDKLDKPQDPLSVYLPLGIKVAVNDPELTREVVFETDNAATAINAAIGAVIVPGADGTRELVTLFDSDTGTPTWLHSFNPFGDAPAAGNELIFGLVLRPKLAQELAHYAEDSFPTGPLDLYVDMVQVFDQAPDGTTVSGPLVHQCAALQAQQDTDAGSIEWQVFIAAPEQGELFDQPASANGWATLNVTLDETLGLSRSGHVVMEIPRSASAVSPRVLPADFWRSFNQNKPPSTLAELTEAIGDPAFDILHNMKAADWLSMGLNDAALADVLACDEDEDAVIAVLNGLSPPPAPAAVSAERWAEIEPAFAIDMPMADGALRRMVWIRAVLDDASADTSTVRTLQLNTVPATQAATRRDENLGRSNGRPGQTFSLQATPVLIDPQTGLPDLELTLTDANSSTVWTRVDSFYAQKADSTVYLLDPGSGEIRFGDGRTGQIPVADTLITATRYRTGGGAIGNVAAGTITAIKGKVSGVKSVTNLRTASDGADAESLDDAKLRAPQALRVQDRAVSADDFAYLARQTPGVAVHAAYALARKIPVPGDDGSNALADKDGAVTVVILPANDQATPQPSEAQLRAVCAWLAPRRLITTELYVIGPRYAEISQLSARLSVASGYDLRSVSDAASAALLAFLHPISGGADGQGWPFGEDIFHADLYRHLLAIDGVRRVSGLTLSLKDVDDSDPLADVTALPDGTLPWLPRAAIALDARYD